MRQRPCCPCALQLNIPRVRLPFRLLEPTPMLKTFAHAALMADGTLGGLALGIREQECEWEVEDADAVAAAIPARYRITYRTRAHDLSTPG